MNLFIAKESALIYADEVYNKSLSKILDKKREGGQRNVQEKSEREGLENQINRLTYLNLEENKKKPIVNLIFALVFLFALINTSGGSLLIGLWGIVGSIVCPLIVTVLPGSFFYYVLKDMEVENNKLKAAGICYSLFGLVLLPIYLTLSTKNLFMMG
jgi:amino acid permease